MVYGPCSSSLKSKIEYCQADQVNGPGSLRGNGLTPEKEISLAGLSPLQNTFLAFSLSNIPRFPLGRSITKSYFSFVLSSVCFMDGGLFT